MNILYFSWNEALKNICIKELKTLGHNVTEFVSSVKKYDHDIELMDCLEKSVGDKDIIFSFNYFPDVSRVAEKVGIPYVSWVYDSPHLTLMSNTLGNRCNRVFLFDHYLYEKLLAEGFDTVRYLPLPARIVENNVTNRYTHDITFLGSLYDGDQDQYGRIRTFPDRLKGFLDALIATEEKVYGFDVIDNTFDDQIYSQVSQFVNAELGSDYRKCGKEIFKDMMRRRVTRNERRRVLKLLGDRYNLSLYSGADPGDLPVKYLGYADYEKDMPRIFYESKINLNVSLRSIQSGIPLRVMDILGAGGFCLTNYQPEIAEYFENEKHLVWYEGMEDLLQKADFYLTHDEKREKIASEGRERAAELFSYSKQFARILEEL